MRKIKVIALLLMLVPAFAYADMKFAVLDPAQAIMNTQFVQNRQAQLQDTLKDKESRAKTLAKKLQKLQQDLKKNGMTMSKEEKSDLRDKFTAKNMEFQSLRKQIQTRIKTDHRDVLQTIQPKLMELVKKFAKDHDIDTVINKQAVLYSEKNVDITRAITSELDKLSLK